ncbi:hypothetical protein H2508_03100 [Parahaliea sp. F7430]|uniref:Uncharacterized protein n=1 Tax=Sediminihaliea albiluteola TaxID=2758564 RepID=A0A7W2TUA0_9GAMM|nr:hypothetical protein [Sediminihaliea albiluteola]MBA6412092.1 hypothetical protein [Sediminihaliea albiluteola]
MLSEETYQLAMASYIGAALLAILCLAWWLRKHWRPAWIAALLLPAAALLLTPAYPEAGIETMAPALIVAAFQWLTVDQAAAEHALRPLLFVFAAAVLLALILGLTILRHRRQEPADDTAQS